MKELVLILLFFVLRMNSVSSQEVLKPKFRDGVYDKEHTQKYIYNNNLGDYYHNYFFRTTEYSDYEMYEKKEVDSLLYDADSNIIDMIGCFNLYHINDTATCRDNFFNLESVLKLEDCIFINPLNNFTCIDFSRNHPNSILLLNENEKEHCIQQLRHKLPNSLRFYIDTSQISILPKQVEMVVDSGFNFPTEKYLTPFYFRKYEVTNKEYREFATWVRDSIARMSLYEAGLLNYGIEVKNTGEYILNWETPIDWNNQETKDILEFMFYPAEERFYKRAQLDTKKIIYKYTKKNNYGETIVDKIVYVYPDTLTWINDFPFSINEPMTNMYNWHQSYNNYPVVGISYWQAKAFLHWKTQKHQKELDAKGIKLKIEYDLPNEAEWEMALSAEDENNVIKAYTSNYNYFFDRSWTTDLCLRSDRIKKDSTDIYHKDTVYKSDREDALFTQLYGNLSLSKNFKADFTFHTSPSNIEFLNEYIKIKWPDKYNGSLKKQKENNKFWKNAFSLAQKNRDSLGICYMGGNVSEWLNESYQQNWKPIFEKRQELLKTFNDEDIKILAQIEQYYDKKNDKNGRLVRGSNWYDERMYSIAGKNTDGSNAKVFLSPDSARCTVGFRYVIRVYPQK
jgi:formylglycine-generating enzyme required for sulfatase activity